MKPRTLIGHISLALIAGVLATGMTACSNKEKEQQPEVTVQVAQAKRGKIEQVIRTEAILFPRDQAALTPKITSPVRTFYVNRGSKVHRGQLLAVLENRDLAAAPNKSGSTAGRPCSNRARFLARITTKPP